MPKGKNRLYYLQWEPELYLIRTVCLTIVEDALYRRLIDVYWMQGSLPNNLEKLRRYARAMEFDLDEFEQMWINVTDVEGSFYADGDFLKHKKLDELKAKILKESMANSEAGKKSAEKRKEKNNGRSTDVQRTFNHTDVDIDIYKEKESVKEKEDSQQKVNGHDLGAVGVPPQTPTPKKSKKEKKQIDYSDIENLKLDNWQLWMDYRKEAFGKTYKTKIPAMSLARYPQEVQVWAVNNSMENEYQGLFPDKYPGARK